MTEFLTPEDMAELKPAAHAFPSPIPTQVISNGEFLPAPQNARQREVESRIQDAAGRLSARHGQIRSDQSEVVGNVRLRRGVKLIRPLRSGAMETAMRSSRSRRLEVLCRTAAAVGFVAGCAHHRPEQQFSASGTIRSERQDLCADRSDLRQDGAAQSRERLARNDADRVRAIRA